MNRRKDEENVELLKEYYAFDEESKIFTIPISFYNVNDVVDCDVIDPKNNPMFKREAMEKIKDTVMGLPGSYKADIHLKIGNYEDYDPKVLMKSFNKAILLNQQRSQIEQRRSGIIAAILALAGFLILFLYIFGRIHGWYGENEEELGYAFITEVLDIVAWVFIWEAVSFVFLYENDYRSINIGLLVKINTIGFYDGEGKAVLDPEDLDKEIGISFKSRRYGPIGKNFLLLGSIIFLVLGGFLFINRLINIIVLANSGGEGGFDLVVNSLGVAEGIACFLAGLAGISLYDDKPLPARIMGPWIVVLGLLTIAYSAFAIMSQSVSNYASMAFCLFSYIIYIIGYVMTSRFSIKKK